MPDLSNLRGAASNPQNDPVDGSYGFYQYSKDDEEGQHVQYEGEFNHNKRQGKGFIQSLDPDDRWSYCG